MDSSANEAALLGTLEEARRQFLALVDDVRPELHRYCTRMTGSVADGEDVVQDTLARAYYQLSEQKELPPLRPWLFRIAHNRAIDRWRHDAHRMAEPIDAASDLAADEALEPDHALARHQAVNAAISCFLQLAPAQRGCVILKDVLDHSLDEIAGELDLSVPAVKAALHRGRAQLRQLSSEAAPARPPARAFQPALLRYASLFNAHDWDGVRAMLADEVRLDLVSRRKAVGRREVAMYFTNYARLADWHLAPGWLDGREVLAVFSAPGAARPSYFIELALSEDRITAIHDFRYVPYIAQEAAIEFG
ncbi:RNA polymerase sigma factor (sigma-70 family) [Variovorax paradoxus]|jgi:RNA polymerase sigma factor (sigma-70 family)|uniref:RNA polymerase sigma factor n=1 Tax=Variovorax paradoxus TaxID=34073 RepID=UPI002793AC9D|nr:RNA polymerase sigma factor [Variovorax paradoxus]MDQ0572330.1 RNA polymerase sigma factor (sigma-70 family) [Variovorax paradoxus]